MLEQTPAYEQAVYILLLLGLRLLAPPVGLAAGGADSPAAANKPQQQQA